MAHSVGTRSLATFLGAFFAFALLAACSPKSPESVAKDYITAVANKRIDEAVEYFALEDIKENDLTAAKGKFQMVAGSQYAKIQENGGLDSVSTSLIDNEDNIARVEVKMKYKNGKTRDETFKLTQESGKWKIKLK